MVGKYVSLGLLIVLSIVHIISLCIQNRKMKSITKIFILPLIISFYLFSVSTINWLLLSALICGWIGDLILIPRNKKVMTIGGIFFGAEQVLLATTLAMKIAYQNISIALPIVIPFLYAIFTFIYLWFFLKKHVKTPTFIIGNAYLMSNGVTNAMAMCLLISNPCLNTALIFVGTTCFYLSDMILIYSRMTGSKKLDPKHIFVMITYIIAQFLITFGLI